MSLWSLSTQWKDIELHDMIGNVSKDVGTCNSGYTDGSVTFLNDMSSYTHHYSHSIMCASFK